MIDVENEIFNPIAEEVRVQFPGAYVTGEYVREPSKFPHVSIVEMDNYMTHLDTSNQERYSAVMYEVNVYSNKATGKKSECRAIMGVIDAMMYCRNFVRISMNPVPNLENATIYRITARYVAETDGHKMFRK